MLDALVVSDLGLGTKRSQAVPLQEAISPYPYKDLIIIDRNGPDPLGYRREDLELYRALIRRPGRTYWVVGAYNKLRIERIPDTNFRLSRYLCQTYQQRLVWFGPAEQFDRHLGFNAYIRDALNHQRSNNGKRAIFPDREFYVSKRSRIAKAATDWVERQRINYCVLGGYAASDCSRDTVKFVGSWADQLNALSIHDGEASCCSWP